MRNYNSTTTYYFLNFPHYPDYYFKNNRIFKDKKQQIKSYQCSSIWLPPRSISNFNRAGILSILRRRKGILNLFHSFLMSFFNCSISLYSRSRSFSFNTPQTFSMGQMSPSFAVQFIGSIWFIKTSLTASNATSVLCLRPWSSWKMAFRKSHNSLVAFSGSKKSKLDI